MTNPTTWVRGDIHARRPDAGFTIVEVLVAMALIAVLAISIAELFGIATMATRGARSQTSTTLLSTEKMEQLRSLTWGFDDTALGLPVTDTTTDLSQDPPTNAGQGLNPSPPNTLEQNIGGYVDFLDGSGQWVGGGVTPPPTAVYLRRWSIEPLPTNPNNTLVFQVLTTTVRRELMRSSGSGRRVRLPEDALIVSVKTRKAR